MNLEELNEEIKEDFSLSEQYLEEKLRQIPNVHNKYMRLYIKEKQKLNSLQSELRLLHREKYYWYKNDFEFTLTASQLEWHVSQDEEYNKKFFLCQRQEDLVDYLKDTVKKASQLSFDVKNLIEYKKLTMGAN